jgi:hypothetical protein
MSPIFAIPSSSVWRFTFGHWQQQQQSSNSRSKQQAVLPILDSIWQRSGIRLASSVLPIALTSFRRSCELGPFVYTQLIMYSHSLACR